jgi:hypothetical protein
MGMTTLAFGLNNGWQGALVLLWMAGNGWSMVWMILFTTLHVRMKNMPWEQALI